MIRQRILAQMVRLDGRIHRLAVLSCEDGKWQVAPLGQECHSTLFFNGLIALVPEGAEVPESVPAADAEALARSLPEGTVPVRIPFR